MSDMNTVSITGRLTRDPELVVTSGGTSIGKLGVAVNGRKKQGDDWVDDANFFDVTIFGRQAETAVEYLSKGRQVGITGRLDWQSWEKDGQKRSKVEIIANNVVYLGSKPDSEDQGQRNGSDLPAVDTSDFGPTTELPEGSGGDDIPW